MTRPIGANVSGGTATGASEERVSADHPMKKVESTWFIYKVWLYPTGEGPELCLYFPNYPSLEDLSRACDLVGGAEYRTIVKHTNWPEVDPEDDRTILIIVQSGREYVGSIMVDKHKLVLNPGPMSIRVIE